MFSLSPTKVNYEEEIGAGNQGIVYAYQHKNLKNEDYVVKRITTQQSDIMLASVQEIVLGFSCDHPYVLPVKGYHIAYDKGSKLWNIFIKMPRMETTLKKKIHDYIKDGKTFPEEEVIKQFYSLTLGLKYLHNKSIAHRDIKPDNILIDKYGRVKIADIGIGKFIDEDKSQSLTTVLGTPLYTAPEILTQAAELKKKGLFIADIWSLGVTMAEMCIPKTKLINTNENGKANEANLIKVLKGLQGRYNVTLLNLISGLLRANPNERKSLEEIQQVLEDNFSDILLDVVEKSSSNDEEKKLLKSKLVEAQKQVQQLQEQLQVFQQSLQNITKTLSLLEINPSPVSDKILNNKKSSVELNAQSQAVPGVVKEELKFQFQGNCFKTINGHNSPVRCLELLETGELVSSSFDMTIKIWDIKNGTCKKTLTGHTNYVLCLHSLSSNMLISGSDDKTIKLWNTETGACVKTLQGHTGYVRDFQLLSTGELVSCSRDKTIKLWDLEAGKCVKTLKGHDGYIRSIQVLPTEELASGSDDRTIKIWNIKTSVCTKDLVGHSGPIYCLRLLPTGYLASGSSDKTVRLWDVKMGACLKILGTHDGSVRCLQVLISGEVVSGAEDKTIRVWDTNTGTCLKTLQGHSDGVMYLQVMSNGELASCSDDKTIKLWN